MAIYGIHGAYLSRTMTLGQSTKAFGLVSLWYGVGTVVGNYLIGYIRENTGDFFLSHLLLALVMILATGIAFLLPNDDIKAAKIDPKSANSNAALV